MTDLPPSDSSVQSSPDTAKFVHDSGPIPLTMAIANYRMYSYKARIAVAKANAWGQIAHGIQTVRQLQDARRSTETPRKADS